MKRTALRELYFFFFYEEKLSLHLNYKCFAEGTKRKHPKLVNTDGLKEMFNVVRLN